MIVTEDGLLKTGITTKVSEVSQTYIDARLFFRQNPFKDTAILKDFLNVAIEMGKLEGAKLAKIKELVKNPYVNGEVEVFDKYNLLDDSRKKAIELINSFK